MKLFCMIYTLLLFYVFTPGILFTLPKKGKRITIAVVHTILFSVTWYISHLFLPSAQYSIEGADDNAAVTGNVVLTGNATTKPINLVSIIDNPESINRINGTFVVDETIDDKTINGKFVLNNWYDKDVLLANTITGNTTCMCAKNIINNEYKIGLHTARCNPHQMVNVNGNCVNGTYNNKTKEYLFTDN